ncbi:hypothetical protein [Novosphingobium sp. FKTRR1]|uniref:hypothetical protein n=1 Tax=unclassified Novosphingobium TaxID=2644732 RepID=UPI001CF086FE|nr:hypothetical protein [Novosphingobium sp. FKTRR1]
MKDFFRDVSPRRAVLDLWQFLGAPREFRWTGLFLAACVTGGIFVLMINQGWRGMPRRPEVIYIQSWRADRSDAEIIAGNIEATRKARAEAAEEEFHAENIRKMYKTVGAATGLDTQKMYDDGKAEREAEQKAEAARNKALLDRYLEKKPGQTATAAAQGN